MKLQNVTKLPASKGLARAVQQGNNVVHNGPSAIAGLNLHQGAEVYTFPEAYLYAMSMYCAKEFLRYQAWLQANSVVPDGVTCWMKDPKPHPIEGVRWDNWVGARHEYQKRASTSRTQPKHLEPVDLKLPAIFRDANWYLERAYDELHGVILDRLNTQYDDQGRYSPSAPIAADEHECTVTLPQQAVLRDYTALRIRDRMRRHDFRLVSFFEDEAKQARYAHLCTKYKVHPVRRFVTGNMRMFVAIHPANQERHIELSYRLMHKFDYKPRLKDRVKEPELPHVESATGWLGNLPCGEFLVEAEKKDQLLESKMPVVEESVVNETIKSPTQLDTHEKNDWHALGHSDHEYGECLEAMSSGLRSPKMIGVVYQLLWSMQGRNKQDFAAALKTAQHLVLENKALKVGTMGDVDMVGPPTPPKLDEQYKLSSFAALVYGVRNTNASLVEKKIDTDKFLQAVGGPSAFVQDDESGLYLPPADYDENLPAWEGLSSSV